MGQLHELEHCASRGMPRGDAAGEAFTRSSAAIVPDYATVSALGVPIDTLRFVFGAHASPTARRPAARGRAKQPAAGFAAIAAAHDTSTQTNGRRYIGEIIACDGAIRR